jgi:uroporphyrinogen-III synthase
MLGPLAGFTVGITGDRRSEEQAELLARRGAHVILGSMMRTTLLSDADAAMRGTELALSQPFDVVVLTTGIGTRSWFGVAETAGLDEPLRVACAAARVVARGPKARGAAKANGVDIAWEAPGETNREVLAHLERLGVAGKRVVIQRDGGEPVLADAVRAMGADVVDVAVYQWQRPLDEGPAVRLLDAVTGGRVHALTFTCAHAVRTAFELAPDPEGLRDALSGPVVPVAVGDVTAGALRERGVHEIVMPARARLGAMVQALVGHLTDQHRTLRFADLEVRWQGDLLVQPDGSTATLTVGERRVLHELLRRSPAVVAKRVLAESGADEHAAEAAVARLRVKLGALAPGIRTVPRRGYSCTLDVRPAPALVTRS